ncbi:efflux RND transporter permease subunit, partial [Salmonella sp. gx-f4]|nr:efflux RND transporter permease subunit [Salmonella sp. gx-f4]
RELRDKVEAIQRSLVSLPDIGKTTLLGVQEEQMVIDFSPRQLAGMGITLQQVMDALKQQNAVVPSGMLRSDRENIALRVSGAL